MMILGRLGAIFLICAGLAGCAADPVWAPEEDIRAARYAPGGTPSVRVLTMISNNNGSGGHSALLIDGAQRLLFDPSGTWQHPQVPERNDVLFGLTPPLLEFYYDYHARETYHIVEQRLAVTPAVAAYLSEQVQAYGAVPNAQCALSISSILSNTPGFDTVARGVFPVALMNSVEEIPGVQTRRIYDDDADDNYELLLAQAAAARRAELAQQLSTD